MFIVLLKFSEHRDQAASHMDGHKAWIKKGFNDGVFILAGSLQPGLGGAVLATGLSRGALQDRVNADPFVAKGVVTADILDIEPGMTDPRLEFLKG